MDCVGVVGVGEGDGEAEWAVVFAVLGGVVEEALGFVEDFFVVFELVGADAGARLQD